MLRHILNPAKVNKVEELSTAVESWEEMVRQYESRRKTDASRHQLDEEIKIAILEHIAPVEPAALCGLHRCPQRAGDVPGDLPWDPH